MKNKLLVVIPARGGSKGLKNKNLLMLGGKPLIAWTIEAALNSTYVDKVVVSSDSSEIREVANKFGAETPFSRPNYLSDDEALSIDVILHAIQNLPLFEYVCMLQPTSPLRTNVNIDEAFSLLLTENANSCVSVTKSEQSPFWTFSISENGKLQSLFDIDNMPARRQELPDTYYLNGAIYIAKTSWLLKSKNFLTNDTLPFIMSNDVSVDIDTKSDFEIAEKMILSKIAVK